MDGPYQSLIQRLSHSLSCKSRASPCRKSSCNFNNFSYWESHDYFTFTNHLGPVSVRRFCVFPWNTFDTSPREEDRSCVYRDMIQAARKKKKKVTQNEGCFLWLGFGPFLFKTMAVYTYSSHWKYFRLTFLEGKNTLQFTLNRNAMTSGEDLQVNVL